MAIACEDWRGAEAERVAPLYAAEIDRWATELGWDTAASWAEVERGRRLGTVPGLLAIDETGGVLGWTFYLLHRAMLQIGGFVAASEAATAALLAGVLESELASSAEGVTLFAFAQAPGLTDAVRRRGLAVETHAYLSRPLSQEPLRLASRVRRWRMDDVGATVELLARAYAAPDPTRPFAPRGDAAEWREYVGQLVGTNGCGALMPDSCFAVQQGSDRLAGIVLVSRLSPTTAHIAQVAVDPQLQGLGVGRLLVGSACSGARRAGCDRITLLVGERNRGARRLYESSGFVLAADFVSAGGRQPLRLTSVAAGGGAVTRR